MHLRIFERTPDLLLMFFFGVFFERNNDDIFLFIVFMYWLPSTALNVDERKLRTLEWRFPLAPARRCPGGGGPLPVPEEQRSNVYDAAFTPDRPGLARSPPESAAARQGGLPRVHRRAAVCPSPLPPTLPAFRGSAPAPPPTGPRWEGGRGSFPTLLRWPSTGLLAPSSGRCGSNACLPGSLFFPQSWGHLGAMTGFCFLEKMTVPPCDM